MGVVSLSVLFAPVCFSMCPANQPGPDFSQEANCALSSHSFVKIGIGLSALFTLPLLGLFLYMKRLSIPPGFVLSLFRPPRFVF